MMEWIMNSIKQKKEKEEKAAIIIQRFIRYHKNLRIVLAKKNNIQKEQEDQESESEQEDEESESEQEDEEVIHSASQEQDGLQQEIIDYESYNEQPEVFQFPDDEVTQNGENSVISPTLGTATQNVENEDSDDDEILLEPNDENKQQMVDNFIGIDGNYDVIFDLLRREGLI